MSIYSAIMTTDPVTRDREVNGEILRHAVSRRIFCPFSGVVMDCRTAVMVGPDAIDGKFYDTNRAAIDAAIVKVASQNATDPENAARLTTVIDGREIERARKAEHNEAARVKRAAKKAAAEISAISAEITDTSNPWSSGRYGAADLTGDPHAYLGSPE